MDVPVGGMLKTRQTRAKKSRQHPPKIQVPTRKVDNLHLLFTIGPRLRFQLSSATTFCAEHLTSVPDVIRAFKTVPGHRFSSVVELCCTY